MVLRVILTFYRQSVRKEVSAELGRGTKHPSILLGRLIDNKIEAKIFVLHVGTWDERS